MKIKKIEVKNYKAVSEQELNLNGCSAIITAGNDKGKTSILRGLVDRLHSEKPDIVVKQGKSNGHNIVELTDGSKVEWNFTNKSERLSYVTADGIKQTSGVIGAIGEKYFGKQFDIDSFLRSSPKQQEKELQAITGVDLEEIEQRYQKAYEERTEANRELKRVSARKVEEPEKVDKPDIDSIKKELGQARVHNEGVKARNAKAEKLETLHSQITNLIDETAFEELFDHSKAEQIIKQSSSSSDLIDVSELETKLDKANEQLRKYDGYERELQDYNDWIKEGKKARKEAEKADEKVKAIEQEKKEAIAGADMPEGFDIDENGLTYNGFPLSQNQISQSSKYIAALKLGAMVLGEVKTLHFDASSLDKNSLGTVQDWAEEKGLQLLIERPDWDNGEITYELLEQETA